jgi:hypothetical protein
VAKSATADFAAGMNRFWGGLIFQSECTVPSA